MQRKRHSAELKAKVALEALRGQKTANEIASAYRCQLVRVRRNVCRSHETISIRGISTWRQKRSSRTSSAPILYMHLQPGQVVLDVGCGPGIDTLALASLVGSTGQVVGVDHDAAMDSEEAEKRAAQAGCSAWCHHYQADAAALPQPPNTFDASRSERLFQHVLNPAAVLSEMARVTKPGGWVVVLDTDWSTLSFDTPEVDLERRLSRYRLEHLVNSGYVGRQLYGLFKRQQFTEIAVEPRPIYVTDYALGRYASHLEVVESEALAAGVITE